MLWLPSPPAYPQSALLVFVSTLGACLVGWGAERCAHLYMTLVHAIARTEPQSSIGQSAPLETTGVSTPLQGMRRLHPQSMQNLAWWGARTKTRPPSSDIVGPRCTTTRHIRTALPQEMEEGMMMCAGLADGAPPRSAPAAALPQQSDCSARPSDTRAACRRDFQAKFQPTDRPDVFSRDGPVERRAGRSPVHRPAPASPHSVPPGRAPCCDRRPTSATERRRMPTVLGSPFAVPGAEGIWQTQLPPWLKAGLSSGTAAPAPVDSPQPESGNEAQTHRRRAGRRDCFSSSEAQTWLLLPRHLLGGW